MADSSKLPRVQTALTAFMGNIKGKNDRLGLIDFSDRIKYNSGVQSFDASFKNTLDARVKSLRAEGNTAVIDSVLEAYNTLQELNDPLAINAIVVMTDGKENASRTNITNLERVLTQGKVPVVVFSIAFGKDADTGIMKRLAEVTNGQFRQAETFNIEELYKLISTYF
jgi:Ca-activated chloride channel family protein